MIVKAYNYVIANYAVIRLMAIKGDIPALKVILAFELREHYAQEIVFKELETALNEYDKDWKNQYC